MVSQRLFVDVDDTLVIYDTPGPNPYGVYKGSKWEPNIRLIEGIKDFQERNPESLVVIWSGGGSNYARQWIETLDLDDDLVSLIKDSTSFHLIREGDIVVDDMDLDGYRTHKPNEWPQELG